MTACMVLWMRYMNEIREINSISYNRIYNGQQLIVPYYSDALR